MKLTKMHQFMIIGFLGFVLLSFLFYQFALKPINRDIAGLESTRDQKKKELEDAKKMVARYVEFKKRADSIQRELEWIQNRIPKSIDKSRLIEAVSFLQNRSGVYLTTFQVTKESPKDAFTEIPVNIRFNTNFEGLLNFLKEVSVSSLFMTVRDLSITPNTDPDHKDVTLSAQMVLSGIQAK